MSVLAGMLLGVFGFSTLREALPSALSAPTPLPFSDTDDVALQRRELGSYAETYERPHRVVQVDLKRHPKFSQFTDIDSSRAGFGRNACGLVAAAAALGGERWVALVGEIARAAGKDYGRDTGIQPSKYTAALRSVFGADHVRVKEGSSLGDLYRELEAGHIVIVDIKVHAGQRAPSAGRPNYAHYARVLGMDIDQGEIYIENTLRGGAYWTVALDEFVAAWSRPETSASMIPDPKHAEDVTRWAIILDSALLPATSARQPSAPAP